jgi:N-acetylneuraminate synthase
VYFAFPYRDGQLPSGRWTEGITLNTKAVGDAPIAMNQIDVPHDHDEAVLKKSIHEVKALLAYARIALSHEFSTEYSHHYGVRNFRKVGAVLINVVNRDYAKKILVQLAGQEHPSHFHKLKEETFIVLWGELVSVLDGKEIILQPGDKLTVPPGVWHSFKTDVGCVFEEISTTAFSNDSVYRDVKINNLTSDQRKTKVDHWGRFQISKQLRGDPMS